jgi:predicted nucleotidyltransferase
VTSTRQILAVVNEIATSFDPDGIILFGSRAYGRATHDSDVDLLVIMPYHGRPLEKTLQILNSIDPPFALDLILYRPGEVRRRYRQFDPLVREAIDRGKVLYGQRPARMARQGGRRLSGRLYAHARSQSPALRRRLLSRAAGHRKTHEGRSHSPKSHTRKNA